MVTTLPSTTGHTQTADGRKIFYRSWPVENPQACVAIVHGYAEHSGRYHHVAAALNEAGFDAYALDLTGHGESEGRRGHVDRFSQYLDDVDALRAAIAEQRPDAQKHFILGHSNGGLITLNYMIERKPNIRGFVITAPFLGTAMKVPGWKIALGRVMSNIWPTLSMPTGLDPDQLSHDPEIGPAYANDPLVFDTTTARWYSEAMNAIARAFERAGEIKTPCLVMQGTADAIADPQKPRELFEKIGSPDKEYVDFPGMYHEIMNEVENEKVIGKVREWFVAHL